MLIECKYWMASPMLFMISEASAEETGAGRQSQVTRCVLRFEKPTAELPVEASGPRRPPPRPQTASSRSGQSPASGGEAGLGTSPEQVPGALLPRRPAGPAADPFYLAP